jgi:hypothetical protein
MCPRAGSAIAALTSSILRPTARSARSPRRHRPSRSANAGSCNPPAATRYAGKSKSSRARHCAAGAVSCRRSGDNAMNGRMSASWAACHNHRRGFARFPSMEPRNHRYLRHTLENITCFGWWCRQGSMDDKVLHGYLFMTPVSQNQLALNGGHCTARFFGVLGKEPT